MSLYQLHRCVYDSVKAGAVSSGHGPQFDVARYDLDETERVAFEKRDIAELYRLGLHPVLLNGFCRAAGYTLNSYRDVLQVYGSTEQRRARWQK
jgi:hypothetical protein